jgi:hypothetical protein
MQEAREVMNTEKNQSEVAALLARIDAEYEACRLVLSGPVMGVARHQFITARQESIGQLFEQLGVVTGGKEEAMRLLVEQQKGAADETPLC